MNSKKHKIYTKPILMSFLGLKKLEKPTSSLASSRISLLKVTTLHLRGNKAQFWTSTTENFKCLFMILLANRISVLWKQFGEGIRTGTFSFILLTTRIHLIFFWRKLSKLKTINFIEKSLQSLSETKWTSETQGKLTNSLQKDKWKSITWNLLK